MIPLTFDEHGYLSPNRVIPCSLDTVEQHFVQAFPSDSFRRLLWAHYQQFLQAIQRNIAPNFKQWIDGSFVTTKPNPKDIDIVIFLDSSIYQQKEAILEDYWSFSLEGKGLDVYWVEVYPPGHVNFANITQTYQTLWANRFGLDRFSNKKGFLEITL